MLLKRPGFTIVAIITLALGIGVNTALFTCFNIFLRPKPIKDPDAVVKLEYQGARREQYFSFHEYDYFRKHTQVFSDVIANFQEKFLLGEKAPGVEPEEVLGNFVSDNFLSTLGGHTQMGRFFTSEENSVAGRDAVVVLSHRFWERRFAADERIIGRPLLLNGRQFSVIGVTSPQFVGLRYEMPDIWLPLMMRGEMASVHFEEVPAENRDWFGKQDFPWLILHARLQPDKTPAHAQAELALLLGQLRNERGDPDSKDLVTAAPVSQVGGDNEVWPIMAAVLGASGLVLLIACFNLANMMLARAASRQKEIGVRLCLGASRWRLVRQLLTESILLASLGGVAGLLLAWWSLSLAITVLLTRYGGGDVARLALDISPDYRVLVFSFLLSLASGIAFGLAPALNATRPDLIGVIKSEGSNASVRVARSWLRSGLVVAQVSLCLILLISAGLLLRGLRHVLSTDPGFAARNLIFVNSSLELSGYDAKRAELFQQRLMARLATLPGVQSVARERDFAGRLTIKLPEETGTSVRQFDRVPLEWVTANYLETIGTPVIQGRGFTAAEVQTDAPVLIISEATARNLWPNEYAPGKTVRVERPTRDGSTIVYASAEVIGVARDNQIYRVGQTPPLFFYAPKAQPEEWMDLSFLVRTAGDASSLKQVVRHEAYALEPILRLGVDTMAERIARDNSVNETRAASELTSFLGGLALLLAAIGIYGVMAWSVGQRTREIGIRMALGAQGRDVLMMVIRQGMRLVMIGIAIGLPISLAVTQVMKSLLFGLSTTDPVAFGLVTALLGMVGLLACYFPARRATRVDPLVALRYE